ncbi:MAG: hypothetical protein II775_09525, partial [Prevotella sp.]|nr:hypothetical protein [Prevotella sp.]
AELMRTSLCARSFVISFRVIHLLYSSDEENVKRKCNYFQFKLNFSIVGAFISIKSGEDGKQPIFARLV